jgi:hypothetical protein
MKAFLASVVVGVGVAVAAFWVLDTQYQVSAPNKFTTDGVRLGDPGSNLIRY